MIKNIIFDIGNVLMTFKWKPFIKGLYKDEALIAKIENSIWHSGLWNEFDRNVIPEEEIIRRMRTLQPEIELEVAYTLEQVSAAYGKADYAIPWVQELKARGYRVYFLSNYSAFSMRNKPEALDFLPYMDGGIFSCDVQAVKPERRIYECLCERYGLEPAECIFLDDNAANVEAGIAFGMQSIHVIDYPTTKEELEARLAADK